MTDRAVFKWVVPVDDQPHEVGGGEVVHVGLQFADQVDVVTLWTVETRPGHAPPIPTRMVQVFGTGHPLPFFATPLGTAVAMQGKLVWHLMQVTVADVILGETGESVSEPVPIAP